MYGFLPLSKIPTDNYWLVIFINHYMFPVDVFGAKDPLMACEYSHLGSMLVKIRAAGE